MPTFILPSAGSTATGFTRTAYRRALAAEIGHFRLTTATTDTTDPRFVTLAAFASDGAPQTRTDGHYLYAPSFDEAHRILEGSYDGATAYVALDQPFSAPLLAGTEIEITNTLPGTWLLDLKGTNQIVNDALNRLLIWARLPLTGNGTRSQSLASYANWLTHEDMIDHIEDRISSTDPYEPSAQGFVVQQDGVDRTLVTERAYDTSDTFVAVAIRRGDAWIRSAGVWAASTIGLASETDEAAAPLHWVRAFGAVLALRYLLDVTEEDETLSEKQRAMRMARYTRQIATYRGTILGILANEIPKPTPRPPRPMVAGVFSGSPRVADIQIGLP